jgi:hypothetical protein
VTVSKNRTVEEVDFVDLSALNLLQRVGMRRILVQAFSLTVAGLIACRDSTAPPAPCTGAISVNVAGSAQPSFVWSPACGISLLTVATVPASSNDVERAIWGFTVPERAPVGPGINYGKSPRNATVWRGPEALAVGKTYHITVMYTVGGDGVVASGGATFTWFPPD